MNSEQREQSLQALQSALDVSSELTHHMGHHHTMAMTFVMLLFMSVFDMTKDMCILLRELRFSLMPAAFRSVLEALVDIKFLAKDPKNFRFLDVKRTKLLLSITDYRLAQIQNGPQQEDGRMAAELRADRAGLQKTMEKHRAEKTRPLTERDKFDRADMLDLYFSAYQVLSMQPHNNTQNLFNRYVDMDQDGAFTAEWDKQGTVEEFDYWYSMISMIYIDVARSVADFFGVAFSGQIEKMAGSLDPFIKDLPESLREILRRQTQG